MEVVHVGTGGGGGVQPVTHHVALQQEPDFEGKTSRQTCAASRCQIFGSTRAGRRLLGARARLWRHRSLPRNRGDQLPSGAQLFFAVCFDWHLAGKYASPFKMEQMMFLKSNQESPPKVQKYNAVIAAQQEIRRQCIQDVQSAQKAAAGETVGVEI